MYISVSYVWYIIALYIYNKRIYDSYAYSSIVMFLYNEKTSFVMCSKILRIKCEFRALIKRIYIVLFHFFFV